MTYLDVTTAAPIVIVKPISPSGCTFGPIPHQRLYGQVGIKSAITFQRLHLLPVQVLQKRRYRVSTIHHIKLQ